MTSDDIEEQDNLDRLHAEWLADQIEAAKQKHELEQDLESDKEEE